MPLITCCKDCEKRHTACWDYCKEYQEQKKALDKKKAADMLSYGLSNQRKEAIRKASKGRRAKK